MSSKALAIAPTPSIAATHSLWAIDATLEVLLERAREEEEWGSGEMEPETRALLEEYGAALPQKVDRVAEFVKACDGEVTLIEREIERLQARKRQRQGAKRRALDMALRYLQAHQVDSVRGQYNTLARQRNAPSARVLDEALLPAEFVRLVQSVEVDKRRVLEALKAGQAVPGAVLEQGEHLRLR